MTVPRRVAPRRLALVGPTAVGKSALALEVASELGDVEIVSVDSMQVYRGMDIGTAKPSVDDRRSVRHHLLDLVDPVEDFTVARYQANVGRAVADIERRGRRPLLVGGTGLYLRAAVDGLELAGRFPDVRCTLDAQTDTIALHARLARLDPVSASRMEPGNRRRVLRALEVTLGSGRPFSSFGPGLDSYPETSYAIVGLDSSRELLDARIEARYAVQLASGFLAEVERLSLRSRGLSRTARQALGYRELLEHLAGLRSLDEAVTEAVRRTRRFARRQQRWFRRDPRISWLEATSDSMEFRVRLLRDWCR